jgi:hypothetical protein
MCPSGQTYTGSGCVGCPVNCLNCSSATVCTLCASTYYLRSDGICYLYCLAGTYPDATTQQCINCPSNCSSCTSSGCTLPELPSIYTGTSEYMFRPRNYLQSDSDKKAIFGDLSLAKNPGRSGGSGHNSLRFQRAGKEKVQLPRNSYVQ